MQCFCEIIRLVLLALLEICTISCKSSVNTVYAYSCMHLNLFRMLRRAGCRGTRMGINQVPIDFELYNLFPSPLPLGCYCRNIEDAIAAFLARFATKSVDFRFYSMFHHSNGRSSKIVSISKSYLQFQHDSVICRLFKFNTV